LEIARIKLLTRRVTVGGALHEDIYTWVNQCLKIIERKKGEYEEAIFNTR